MDKPEWFKKHEEDDDRRFDEISSDTTEIKGDIKVIKENHLAHIQADMWWIKWLVMGLVAGIGSIIVAIVITALLHALSLS